MYVKAIRGSWLDDGRLVDNIVMEGLYLPRECMNVWMYEVMESHELG